MIINVISVAVEDAVIVETVSPGHVKDGVKSTYTQFITRIAIS